MFPCTLQSSVPFTDFTRARHSSMLSCFTHLSVDGKGPTPVSTYCHHHLLPPTLPSSSNSSSFTHLFINLHLIKKLISTNTYCKTMCQALKIQKWLWHDPLFLRQGVDSWANDHITALMHNKRCARGYARYWENKTFSMEWMFSGGEAFFKVEWWWSVGIFLQEMGSKIRQAEGKTSYAKWKTVWNSMACAHSRR